MNNDHKNKILEAYGPRAPSYDDASGGWHINLGQDFVTWLDPQPGETALDLACGTGLVTIPLARKLDAQGRVVAVDLTPQMIQVGKARLAALESDDASQIMAPVEWVIEDIVSRELLSVPTIQQTLVHNGGFDIISICSALVLLPNQQEALRFWVEKLLKKGGRLIVDVPTEDLTLQFMMTYHLPVAIGVSDNLAKGRLWVEDDQSLPKMLEGVGLTIEQNIPTDSYIGTTWYDDDRVTGMQVFEEHIAKYAQIAAIGKIDQARKVWPELWQKAKASRPNGGEGILDGHWLYVCIGRKL